MLGKTTGKKDDEDVWGDVHRFTGRREQVIKPHATKRVGDEVNWKIEEKRRQKKAREDEKKEAREKKANPPKKWSQAEMDTFVIGLFATHETLTMLLVKHLTGNTTTTSADGLIRTALKHFGTVHKKYPTLSYVLKDEYKIQTKEEDSREGKQDGEEAIEFE
jgi:hypothetical protein